MQPALEPVAGGRLAVGARRPRLLTAALPFRVSRRGCRLVLAGASAAVALLLVVVAARHLAETPWPLARENLGVAVAAALLSLLGYGLKAFGWKQLFAAHERPGALMLAAASGGAAITALALPGRFDDVVRIGIVRRFRGCPAGVRTLCLSLFMLGLIDTVALAPFAVAAALLPGPSTGMRLGLALVAAAGVGAAGLIVALPRATASRRVLRFRLGRWLRPRTTSVPRASRAWLLVSACWLTRTVGLLLLLGALGLGYSLALALLFLCASSAAAALPIGPGGAATQAGAGAAVLVASGVGASKAVAVAVAVQLVGMIVGGSVFLVAAVSPSARRLAVRGRAACVRAKRPTGGSAGVRPVAALGRSWERAHAVLLAAPGGRGPATRRGGAAAASAGQTDGR